MNEVEKLIKETELSSSVAYHRFVLLSDNCGTNAFYYFIEGKDAAYYHPKIQRVKEIDPIPIKCGGKSKVIEVYGLLKSKTVYSKYPTGFFVDKDFDDNTFLSSEIYVTPCYSIENLYTQKQVLAEILKCEFDLLPSESQYSAIIDLFSIEQQVFHAVVMDFNAWYACLKKKTTNTGVSLDDNFPKDFIALNIGSIVKYYNITDIENKYPESIKITQHEISEVALNLQGNPSAYLRGKYEMQFFNAFLNFIIEDANVKSKRKYSQKKTTFKVDRSIIMSQLSQYAISPNCLIEYIESRH